MPLELTSNSIEQTMAIGRTIAGFSRRGDVIALDGELGAGKTQMVRGIAGGLGIDPSHVSSPTFVIIQEYESPESTHVLIHIDAYRLGGLDELESIGWDRSFPQMRAEGVVAIEWAGRMDEAIAGDVLHLRMSHAGEHDRTIRITPRGRWLDLFDKMCVELKALESTHGGL